MSPWIGNISPDPKLTTKKLFLSSNLVFVDLGENFTLLLETFLSEFLYRLWAHFHARDQVCKGDRLYARKWIWEMEWMNNASYMSFIERVNNESTRYMY